MDATFRPRHFSAELFAYAENKKIFEMFQNILESFSVDRPEKPLEYLYNVLVKEAVYDVPKVYLLGPSSTDRTLVATVLALRLDLMHITEESITLEDNFTQMEDFASLVKIRLEKPDCSRKGWILVGVPRTRTEAFLLRKTGIFPTHIALIEPSDMLEMKMEEMSDEIKDYLGQKILISDLHRNSYLKIFTVGTDFNTAASKVIEFVRSKARPPMPYLPRVLLLGPYGSGRKTVAKKLAEKYNLIEVNYQHELRKAAMKDSFLKEKICKLLHTSSPIPDDLLVEVACNKLLRRDCIERGWILYNFPDTIEQAEMLVKSLEGFQINRAVFFHASLRVCLDRVEHRRLDPSSGKTYHLKLNPCEEKKIRDRLIQLPQDSAGSVKAEYRFFNENIEQLKLFFQKNLPDDITIDVNASQSEYDVFEAVQGAILKSTKIKCTV